MNDLTFGRPFVLRRDRDISDVSGTGIIADGVVFPDGHAAIHWRGKWPLTTPHPDGLESILAIHDHGGQGDLHVIWGDRRTKGREILAVAVGQAYALADRWRAAHGSSMFLVRAAGAELRDVLDDSGAEPAEVVHATANAQVSKDGAVDDYQVSELGYVQTEKCPHCDDELNRSRLDGHVATAHADLPPCTATLSNQHTEGTTVCAFRVGHRDGEYGDWHATALTSVHGRTVWNDSAKGATPHTEGATEATQSARRTQIFAALRDEYLRRVQDQIAASPEAHIEGLADAVMPVVERLVDEAEQRGEQACDLPHEMEA
jgi:hypothetical protein